jgi:RNA polymerase sigma factor (sigma-70 family)
MDETASDEELMQRYRDGDATAFDVLYARHRGPLFRYFLRLAGPTAIAEELFQDVWMNLIRVRWQYQVRAKFTTWLYRMAHNRLIDHYRRTSSSAPFIVSSVADDDAAELVSDEPFREPDNELERRRLGARLIEALVELPEPQREAFLLREEGGMSLEEVAVATDVNVETAKSRVRYAIAKLRRSLTQTDADTEPDPTRSDHGSTGHRE